MKLPLLDIATYSRDRSTFVRELRSACHTVGFFMLRHNLPLSLAEEQLDVTRSFFQQAPEKKSKISYEENASFRGYMKLGVENTGGQVDWREQVEWAVEDQMVRKQLLSQDPPLESTRTDAGSLPYYERLRAHENPWPQELPSLREKTLNFVHHACRIAECLRKALCLALDLDEDYLTPLFYPEDDEPHWVVKLVSYPPSSAIAPSSGGISHPETSLRGFGVGAHTDTNFLTLVLQDNVGGLQVFSKGEWIDVPVDDSSQYLVVNLGEQAEVFSRGYFLATPHRVVANTSDRERISVPLFYNPALSSIIRPLDVLPESVPWERPKEYDQEAHWRMKSNRMLLSVGENTFKSLARSHPEVFAKHHPDLTLLPDGRMIQR